MSALIARATIEVVLNADPVPNSKPSRNIWTHGHNLKVTEKQLVYIHLVVGDTKVFLVDTNTSTLKTSVVSISIMSTLNSTCALSISLQIFRNGSEQKRKLTNTLYHVPKNTKLAIMIEQT